MYMGITAHRDINRVETFGAAERVLRDCALTPTGKARKEQLYGFPLGTNKGQTWVRRLHDGSIAFRLYETDVVVWHDMDSFSIENFGTKTTSDFAKTFLPDGVILHHPTVRMGEEGGGRSIGFRDGTGQWNICTGDVVTFNRAGDHWMPDEDTCDTIRMPLRPDARVSRELFAEHNLREFENWLAMAPRHIDDLIHQGWDETSCYDALRERNWRRAAEHMPTVMADKAHAFGNTPQPLNIQMKGSKREIVTMGCVGKLKLALLDYESKISVIERKVFPHKLFVRQNQLKNQMETLGCRVYDMGLPR